MIKNRRKSNFSKLVLADEDVLNELDELDEQLPEELEADDLEFLDQPVDDELDVESDDELEDDLEEEVEADDELEVEDDLDDELEADDELEETVEAEDELEDDLEDVEDEDLADELEADDEEEIVPDEKDIVASRKRIVSRLAALKRRKADVNRPGVEDTIGDEANGGNPSMSEIVSGGDDVKLNQTQQKSAIKAITAKLDRLANYCERSGYKKLAYKLDLISDTMEGKRR